MPGKSSKRWQWSDDLLLPVLGACARASWQWPLAYLALTNSVIAPGASLPAWLLVALLLAPGALTKLLGATRTGRAVLVTTGAVAITFATLMVTRATPAGLLADFASLGQGLGALSRLPAAVPALLLVFVCWIEGSAADWVRYAAAWRQAIIGALALVGLTALYAAWGRDSDPHLALAMVVFLLANLLALALLSVRGTLALEQLRHSRQLSVSRYWLSAMVVLILALLLIGWAIASASAPGLVRAVLNALQAAAHWLGRVVAAALAWIMVGIFWLLDPIIAWLRGLSTPVTPQLGGAEALGEQMRQLAEESGDPALAPAWWRTMTSLLGYALLVGGALWLLLRSLRRPRPVAPDNDEERESIFTRDLLGAQLRALFTRGPREREASPYLLVDGDTPVAVVRRAYQAVLQALQQRDWARQPGQTPYALARDIALKLPAATPALERLTEAYANARYGGEISGEQARDADKASRDLLALLSASA